MPGEIASVVIIRNLCIGAGACVDAAPNVFRLDEEHRAVLLDQEGNTEEDVFIAAEDCPTRAIELFDSAGRKLFPLDG